MVLEKLGGSLREALRKIAGASYVDESLIKEIVRDIQRALIQADVNVQLALTITKQLQRRALEEKPPPGMSPREHVVRIIYEELVKILGTTREVPLQKQRILLAGLYGQGKTTTAGKLAKFFQKKGLSVGLVAADVHRPAAYDQLQQLAGQINAAFYGDPKAKDAVKIAKAGVKTLEGTDVIIVDSSGRHALEPDLIAEIEAVAKAVSADERLLVIDATAKGGGALSAVAEVKAPLVFIGVGEKIDDLEKFEPPRFISRLLGMGDLETLLERAQEAIDAQKAEALTKKIMAGKFTLHEMYEQIEMLTDMGTMKKLAAMIPGVGSKMKDSDMEDTQARLKRFKIIMDSMTDEEMKDPKTVKSSRVQRIARGAGVAPRDVKELLRNYETSRKAIKGFAGNRKMRKQMLQQLEASGVSLDEGG